MAGMKEGDPVPISYAEGTLEAKWRKGGAHSVAKPVPEFMQWLASEMGATGRGAKDLCVSTPGAPSHRVLMGWIAQSPEIEKMYLAACRQRVHTKIEDLVERAERLMERAEAGELKKDEVNAFARFAGLIQWIAAKWNKEVYGDHQQTRTIVPVQIVTNLDFGQPGVVKNSAGDMYTIDAEAVIVPEGEGDDGEGNG